jgi:hypothetical protein
MVAVLLPAEEAEALMVGAVVGPAATVKLTADEAVPTKLHRTGYAFTVWAPAAPTEVVGVKVHVPFEATAAVPFGDAVVRVASVLPVLLPDVGAAPASNTTLTVLPAVPVPVTVGFEPVVAAFVGDVITGDTGVALLYEKLTVVGALVVELVVPVTVTVWLPVASAVGCVNAQVPPPTVTTPVGVPVAAVLSM